MELYCNNGNGSESNKFINLLTCSKIVKLGKSWGDSLWLIQTTESTFNI